MLKRLFTFLAAVLLGAGASLAGAQPAFAITCGSTEICFYDNSSGSGASLMYTHDGPDGPGCFDLPSSYRYRTSYIYNRTSNGYRVYLTTGCGGFTVGTIHPNTSGPMAPPWSDSIVSFYNLGNKT